MSQINVIDKLLSGIRKKIGLNIINPTNAIKERKEFLRGNIENPVFTYDDSKIDYSKYIKVLNNIKLGITPIDIIYKKYIAELILMLKMYSSLGTKDFTKYSLKLYGKPDYVLMQNAKELISLDDKRIFDSPRDVSTQEALKIFGDEIKKFANGWELSAEDIVANAIVNPAKRKFTIRDNYHFSRRQIRRFIAHEIYTHILRAECGLLQPYNMFSTGLAGYESTEEGLALYKERMEGVLDRKSLKGYAGRVLAIDIALNSSFRETYDFLRKFYPKSQSWTLTVRVKRGLTDTSQPGAFTKDLIYLKGYYEILDYVKGGNSIKDLHFGKIGIADVPIVKKIHELNDPSPILKSKFTKLYW